MAEVAINTIRKDIWNTVLAAVNLQASSLGVSTVTGAFPAYDKALESKYPIIVISNPISPRSNANASVNGVVNERDVSILIDVYTKKNLELDTITDGLTYAFENNKESYFEANALYWLEIDESEPSQVFLEQGNRLHTKTITLLFKART